jgi:hypothetical protein
MAYETIMHNIKISAKEILGQYELMSDLSEGLIVTVTIIW